MNAGADERYQKDNEHIDVLLRDIPQPEVRKVEDIMHLLGVKCGENRLAISVEWSCSRTIVNAGGRDVIAYWMAMPFTTVFIFKNGNHQFQAFAISRISPYRPEFSSAKEVDVLGALDFIKRHKGVVRDEAAVIQKVCGKILCRVRMTNVYVGMEWGIGKEVQEGLQERQEECIFAEKGIFWQNPQSRYGMPIFINEVKLMSASEFMERKIVQRGTKMTGERYIQEDDIPTDVLESVKAKALSERL
jgi:hypothetical protein